MFHYIGLLRSICRLLLIVRGRRYLHRRDETCYLDLSSIAYGSVSFNYCMFDVWQMPDILNWFGWCTWDAFYTDVNSEGVKQGLERYFST